MNAAARLVHQNMLTGHFLRIHFLSRQYIMMGILMLAVLLSALSVIYVTHVTRILHANYQHHLTEQDRLHMERGQLLLERSTWMMQARVQQFAEQKLGMIIPDSRSVVVVLE